MSSSDFESTYDMLLELYRKNGYRNPKLSLNYDIEKLTGDGMTRAKAIRRLYKEKLRGFSDTGKISRAASTRIKKLEKELEDMRMAMRNRADEVESIKKYLAYTHRSTTSQVIGRIFFYIVGVTLIVLSFFQYNALSLYIQAVGGLAWVFVLDCLVTLSLGIATITLGWVLESMARSQPVF